jgi:hypothetical protein
MHGNRPQETSVTIAAKIPYPQDLTKDPLARRARTTPTTTTYGHHRHQDSLPAGTDQGCDGKEAKDEDIDNDYTIDTIDTDNDYTIDDTATAHLLFLIPPHNPSVPTQAGAHVENAENAQEEEARNPLPIDDRKDTLDVAHQPQV